MTCIGMVDNHSLNQYLNELNLFFFNECKMANECNTIFSIGLIIKFKNEYSLNLETFAMNGNLYLE